MAGDMQEDWSDSDEEVMSEMETNVLLGVQDGPIESPADISDAAVSRIGGRPAFLPSREPPFMSSVCRSCSNPMELLVQMWCPFENAPMDRALYVWGCSWSSCQRKQGSIRAWRGLRYNDAYASKLEKKLARQNAKEKAQADAEASQIKSQSKTNPFSLSQPVPNSPFGLGNQIFGAVVSSESAPSLQEDADDDGESDSESSGSSSSEQSLITALASATLDESPWNATPFYMPLYLSTVSEYFPPPPKSKLPSGMRVQDPADEDDGQGKQSSWAFEAYEISLEVDHVFDRFAKRVGYEGSQCVRYELNGVPLPFSSDAVFERLFPAPLSEALPITKSDFKVVQNIKRSYDPSSIPPCPVCKSKRVFECQLMPNLINVLKSPTNDVEDSDSKPVSDEDIRKAVDGALKRIGGGFKKRGMEWGTCMVFSCEKDCCLDDNGREKPRECWREETVLVQWDD